MVTVKRRPRSRLEEQSSSFSSQLPYGDEGVSPKMVNHNTGWSPGRRFSFEFRSTVSNKQNSSRWLIRLFCALAFVSGIAAYRATNNAKGLAGNLETQQLALKTQGDETLGTLRDAREGLNSIRKYVDALKQTQDALYHEIRMVNEMFEAESSSDMPDSPRRGSSDSMVQAWMQHRQEALTHKIQNLKDFIRQESREQLIEKYGPAPKRVKFTVNFLKDQIERDFVIEMAPLELMPHSVHMFLEMVRLKLWDNTVFWHHDEVEHVVAAALFNYKTGEPKFHHLKALGWEGLQFPEHSTKFPHDKYTIGFSGKGPNIYVNLRNNEDIHGPGSQGHHELPDEADPCFAKVVEGTDVIDAMYRLSLQDQSKEANGREKTWDEMELTRIVKVEMLP